MQRSILVVDPNADRRERLRVLLTSNGSRLVGEAADPDEAMHVAALTHPDVAVMTANGDTAAPVQLVSRLASEHGIPSVLLISAADPETIGHAARHGVMGFVVNPADSAFLHATLEMAVCRFQEVLALQREVRLLRRALEERKVIERAKGLLMEKDRVSEQEAFARLRRKSMDTQRPMVEIAQAVILAAELSGRSR
ncbi:MAG TPA: ANTAR domain-containing protein [Candidatus Methylomirabilis sp.]|nr:ANTAR domain-containing protein [Candidatus Methylomirabilis sp.]